MKLDKSTMIEPKKTYSSKFSEYKIYPTIEINGNLKNSNGETIIAGANDNALVKQ